MFLLAIMHCIFLSRWIRLFCYLCSLSAGLASFAIARFVDLLFMSLKVLELG